MAKFQVKWNSLRRKIEISCNQIQTFIILLGWSRSCCCTIEKNCAKNHSQIYNIKSFIFIPRNIISKSMLSSNFEIFHWLPFLSKSLNFLVTNFCGLKKCNIKYICEKNQDLKRILKFLRSKNITVPFLLWHPVVQFEVYLEY